jgi:hypothetical protein
MLVSHEIVWTSCGDQVDWRPLERESSSGLLRYDAMSSMGLLYVRWCEDMNVHLSMCVCMHVLVNSPR